MSEPALDDPIEPAAILPSHWLDIALLTGPSRLNADALLHLVPIDPEGQPGQRCFLGIVPSDSVILLMSAPGFVFGLSPVTASAEPLVAPVVGSAAIDPFPWFAVILSAEMFEPPAGTSRRATPGPAESGERLSTQERIWVAADRPALCLETASGEKLAPAQVLPLVPGRLLRVIEACRLEVWSTTNPSVSRQASRYFPAISAHLAAAAARGFVAAEQQRAERRHRRVEADQAGFSTALESVSDLVAGRRPAAAGQLGTSDPLLEALQGLAAQERITLRRPPAYAPDAPLAERLRRIALASNFRFRAVILSGHWWREEGPPLLAASASNGWPVGLVWKRGHYTVQGAPGQVPRAVDANQATRFENTAYMLYPGLPDRIDRMSLLRFLTHGIRNDTRRLLVGALLAALAGLLVPVATAVIVGTAIPDGRLPLVAEMALLLFAAAVGSAGFQLMRSIALVRMGTAIDRRLQAAVWDRVLRLPTSFFRNYSVGDLAQRVLGVDAIRRLLSGAVVSAMLAGVFSVSSLALMFVYDATLAFYGFGFALVTGLLLFGLGWVQLWFERQVLQYKGEVTGLLLQLLGGIQTLRTAAAESRAFSLWVKTFSSQRAANTQAAVLSNMQTVLIGALPTIGMLGAFLIAGADGSGIGVAAFSAFSSAFAQFTAAMVSLAYAVVNSLQVLPLAERVKPVFSTPCEVDESRADPQVLTGNLRVKDLHFRYQSEGDWTIASVDFEVKRGEFVAFVGESGSGKSTLLRLLLGFETPARGGIFYDGKDLATLDLRLVRQQIGTVLQSVGLVPGSIYENIAGASPFTRDQVMEAVRAAGMEADIESMPMGLETIVSEGASTLSGGQRQRIIIARALIRRPSILFFDEATSALDNRTQAIVTASLANLQATRIVIAHRLSTIRNADRIFVIAGGQLVEQGRFDELMTKRGTFFRLAQPQLV